METEAMPHFRPQPILTLFSVVSLGVLLWLGNWQVERMQWKADLLAQFEMRGEVNSFQEALCAEQDGYFSPSVTAAAPLSGPELRYYTLRDEAGWVRISLMRVPACEPGSAEPSGPRWMFVESAFETLLDGTHSAPTAWRIDTLPSPRGFGSTNTPESNEWYVFDRTEMAQALGVEPEQVLDVWAHSDRGMPVALSAVPPAKHLGYAITWYGLALALLAVYLALHISKGRLRWR
jgi:surfeit locus 1 family protein